MGLTDWTYSIKWGVNRKMKNLSKIVCVGVLLQALVHGVLWAGPVLFCKDATFNFGDLDNTETVRHVFKLTNDGDEELVLGKITAACGCTAAEVSTKTIAPGGTVDLVVLLNLRQRYGWQEKSIHIASNDVNQPQFRLWLKGNAIADIVATPSSVQVNSMPLGGVVKRTVRLSAREGVTFGIKAVRSTLYRVKTRLETIEEGKLYDLHVEIPAQAEPVEFYDNLMIVTDNKKLPYFSVQVKASVQQLIHVRPQSVILTRPPNGGSVTRFITVREGLLKDFAVTGVEWPNPGVDVEIMASNQFGTRIRISGIQVDGTLSGKAMVVKTTAEGAERVSVPIVVR